MFTHDEFTSGLCEMSCDTVQKLKSKLIQLDIDLRDPTMFKDLYDFAYNYAKERPDDKKLDLETAARNLYLKEPSSALKCRNLKHVQLCRSTIEF